MQRQARIAETQGQISMEQAQFQARMERKAGAEHSQQIRRTSRRGEGAAVAGVAAGGLELRGSPLLAIADQVWQDERAAGMAVTNAEAAASYRESQGMAARVTGSAEAERLRSEAGFTAAAGWLGAFATGLSRYGQYQLMTGGYRTPGPGSGWDDSMLFN